MHLLTAQFLCRPIKVRRVNPDSSGVIEKRLRPVKSNSFGVPFSPAPPLRKKAHFLEMSFCIVQVLELNVQESVRLENEAFAERW